MYEVQVVMLAMKRYANCLVNGVPLSFDEFADKIEKLGASSEILNVLRNFGTEEVAHA